MSYGDKYQIFDTNPNGLEERVTIQQWQWTGVVTTLQGAGPEWWEHTYAVADFADPLPLSEARLRVIGQYGSVLAEIQGADDLAYRVLWETEIASTWETRWFGYLAQQEYADYPFEPVSAIEVRAVDGIGILSEKLYEETGTLYTAREIIRLLARAAPDDAAESVGLGTGLVTRMDWWPYLGANEMASTRDPLNRLRVPSAAFGDADTNTYSTALDVLRQLLGRYYLRCFQSRGRWWAVQPHRYQPDASGDVDVFEYGDASDAASGATPTGTTETVEIDGEDLLFRREAGVERGLALRVREAKSIYDYEPDLDEIGTNGSFEVAGASSDLADEWVHVDETTGGTTERYDLNGFDATNFPSGDSYVMRIEAAPSGSDPFPHIYQETGTYIPGYSGDAALRISYNAMYYSGTSVGSARIFGGAQITVGSYGLTPETVTARIDTPTNGRVSLLVAPVLDSYTGAVTGTPVIPKGANIAFRDGSGNHAGLLTTDDVVSVGDTQIAGRLEGTIEAGDTGTIFVWDDAGPETCEGASVKGADDTVPEMVRFDVDATLVAPDGTFVSGFLRRDLHGGYFAGGSGPTGDRYDMYVDDFKVTLEYAGNVASEIAHQAALALGAGISVDVPTRAVGDREWLIGDGPSLDSFGSIVALDSLGSFIPTQQGEDTGWQVGNYPASGAVSSGRTIDALHAAEVVRSRGVNLERWRLPIHCRDANDNAVVIDPHNVIRHHAKTTTSFYHAAARDYISTPIRLRVGDDVTLVQADGGTETHTVTACYGAGPFHCDLDGMLSEAYPAGTEVRYTRDLFWDRIQQIPGRGLIVYEGTEVYVDDDLPLTEQILQQ